MFFRVFGNEINIFAGISECEMLSGIPAFLLLKKGGVTGETQSADHGRGGALAGADAHFAREGA